MHLAILMTNTDDSAFARKHPRDGEKFADLIRLVRPRWSTVVFAVKDGAFPDDISRFDGAIVTGSPASPRGGDGWIARLQDLIRDMHHRRQPAFGACFGHQAIALALGGTVTDNPEGWVHGRTRNRMVGRPGWARELPDDLYLYGSHKEQVTDLPAGARVICRSALGTVTGYAIGRHIYTTQHHPEMSPGFIAALTEEMAATLGPDLTARARVSLTAGTADQRVFAESVARFFEQAVPARVTPAPPADP